MTAAHPYAGSTIPFATAHGKARLARAAFSDRLGAHVVEPPFMDTDRYGTFSGEIPRLLTPVEAARAKTRLAADATGSPLALASEATFSNGPGFFVEHRELLMFVDRSRGLELVECAVRLSALPPRRTIASLEDARRYARDAGFPVQGIIVRAGEHIHKELRTVAELHRATSRALAAGTAVSYEPDLRAHRSPSRAAVITELAAVMAVRLRTRCPRCATPGFGRNGVERGVPCEACGTPTDLVSADLLGCIRCTYRERAEGRTQPADPAHCPRCNP